MTQTLEEIIARWDSGEGKPYKGSLIDRSAYHGDGEEPPTDIGCMCAQGQVLHLLGGWTPNRLFSIEQKEADEATAKLLNISITHSILLRSINDKVDGAPSIVLTHPEKILGDRAKHILAFWQHLDTMTAKDWDAMRGMMWDAMRDAMRGAMWGAMWGAMRDAMWDATWDAMRDAMRGMMWDAMWDATEGALAEISFPNIAEECPQPFGFLKLFGFENPEALLQQKETRALPIT